MSPSTKYIRLRPGQKRRKGYQWRASWSVCPGWIDGAPRNIGKRIKKTSTLQYRAPRLRKGKK